MAVIGSADDTRIAHQYAKHRMQQALQRGLVTPEEAAAFRGNEVAWWAAFSTSDGFHQQAAKAGWANPGAWLDHGAPGYRPTGHGLGSTPGARRTPQFRGIPQPGVTTPTPNLRAPQGLPAPSPQPDLAALLRASQTAPMRAPLSSALRPPGGQVRPSLSQILTQRKRRRPNFSYAPLSY